MHSTPPRDASALSLFRHPYLGVEPCTAATLSLLTDVDRWKGAAIVWHMVPGSAEACYDLLRRKPVGLPLIVILPPPAYIREVVNLLPLARYLEPRMILPHGLLDTPFRLRQILATPPKSVASVLTDYLTRRGILRTRKAVREFHRIVELAPDTRSVTNLSRRLYTSRRTIGRHFRASCMPVPSHCLHFARVFYVALQLQTDDSAIFRVASRFGYTDGFTLSNQMKRLLGYRPSQVRHILGWEWLIEAWLKKEQHVIKAYRRHGMRNAQ